MIDVIKDDAVLLHYIDGREHNPTDIVLTTVEAIQGYARHKKIQQSNDKEKSE